MGLARLGEAAINSGANLASTALTNKANRDIADQNNQEAIRQFDTNLDWLKYQYEDSKEWNSPEAVRARLVAAGYNPLWTENNGSPATSVGGASPTASMVTPTMQAPQFDMAKDILNLSNARQSDALTDNQTMQNNMLHEALEKGYNTIEQNYRLCEQTIKTQAAQEGLHLSQSSVNRQTKRLLKVQIAQGEAATKKAQSEADAIDLQNKWFVETWDSRVAQIAAEIDNLKAQKKQALANADAARKAGQLSAAQAAYYNKMRDLTDEQIQGVALGNVLKRYGVTDNSPMLTRLTAQVYGGKLSIGDAMNYMDGVAQSLKQTHVLANKYGLWNESHYIWNTGQDMVQQLQAALSVLSVDATSYGIGMAAGDLLNDDTNLLQGLSGYDGYGQSNMPNSVGNAEHMQVPAGPIVDGSPIWMRPKLFKPWRNASHK